MNSQVGKGLIERIKEDRVEMGQQEDRTRKNMDNYYQEVRELLDVCEKEAHNQLARELLDYHERSAELTKDMSKETLLPSPIHIELANDLLTLHITETPAIEMHQLANIIKRAFPVSIGNKKEPSFKSILQSLLHEEEGSEEAVDMSEVVIDKLQCERDYYQRREAELENQVKEMQEKMTRKGINIKEMSKSYLEEKCSKWALERLTEEKKILVQRIGETSQDMIKLNTDIGELQH